MKSLSITVRGNAMMRDLIGQHVGNYRLVKLLGRGGFAEVYLGQHVRLSTQAAIKVLHAHLSDEQINEFEQEAKTIASLEHPHIVRILDFDVTHGIPFLVMDYCSNGTLRKRHAKGEQVPLPTVVSSVEQIADALQYAHDQKIIHRDIKPENMLIGRQNAILISDFGIAATAHSTSSMSAQIPVGTIPYMAPEQIQAQARPASDQYALGIVVYEWLCGTRPFEGSYAEIFAKHLMTPPPPLREKVPSLPPEVEQVVLRALAKDPKQRFETVQAFATALEQASQTKPSTSVLTQPSPSVSSESTPLPVPTVLASPATPAQISGEMNIPAIQSLPSTIPARAAMPPEVQTRSQSPMSKYPASNTCSALQPQLTRRRVLIGLVATGVVAAGGGIIWFATSLKPAIGTLLYTYRGHSNTVYAVAWSPDGKRIASGSGDNTVQVWDAVDGENVAIYKGHSNTVYAVAWSPNGKRIASGSWDSTVQVWDATDGSHVFTYRKHSPYPYYDVYAVAWSPDSKRIASGSQDGTVQVWDATNGGNVFTYRGHSSEVSAVAWSPDGRRIASGSQDSTVQVWDATDGSHVFTYRGHSSWVSAVVWSPDGRRIASGSQDKTVQVWDATDGGNVFTYRGHSGAVLAVAWSPDGKRIASGGAYPDDTVQVWDAVDGGNIFTYKWHSLGVIAVAWSPDGKRIASGSQDETVQVWEAS
jgi:WD40 repeat protein/serine/threonine protein kinase